MEKGKIRSILLILIPAIVAVVVIAIATIDNKAAYAQKKPCDRWYSQEELCAGEPTNCLCPIIIEE